MRRIWAGVSLVVLCTVVAWTGHAAEKKQNAGPGKGAAQPTTEQDYKALLQVPTLTGTLVRAGGSSLTVRLEYQVPQGNTNAGKGNNPGRITPNRNPGKRGQNNAILQALRKAAQNQAKLVTQYKDLELEASTDAPVRSLAPPREYDDRGNPKKYTAEELKKLKGANPKLPGYESSLDKLKPGDIVRLSLRRPRADGEGNLDGKPGHPIISMIVVVGEGVDPNPQRKDRKKNK